MISHSCKYYARNLDSAARNSSGLGGISVPVGVKRFHADGQAIEQNDLGDAPATGDAPVKHGELTKLLADFGVEQDKKMADHQSAVVSLVQKATQIQETWHDEQVATNADFKKQFQVATKRFEKIEQDQNEIRESLALEFPQLAQVLPTAAAFVPDPLVWSHCPLA